MIQVMRELSTELNFLCKESTESVFESIGELSDINLLGLILFYDIHSMFDLLVKIINNSNFLMDFRNLF